MLLISLLAEKTMKISIPILARFEFKLFYSFWMATGEAFLPGNKL